jgi:hypothetical protein
MVLIGAAAPVACCTEPEAPATVREGAALAAVPDPDPEPAAAPVTDALLARGVAAPDAPSFSVPAVMMRG